MGGTFDVAARYVIYGLMLLLYRVTKRGDALAQCRAALKSCPLA